MAKRDYYDILGITKGATQDEIKKAYRKKAIEHHPDKGGDENLFKEVAEAYEVLSNQTKKDMYDKYGHNAPKSGQGGGGFNPFDMFAQYFRNDNNTFGNRQPRQKKGYNLNLTVKLTLEEIFNGTNKKFKYRRNDTCKSCSGSGGTGKKTCPTCQGAGMVAEVINTPIGQFRNAATCGTCEGTGQVVENACNTCGSTGVVNIEDIIDVTIPHGVTDGLHMVVEGKGHAVKNGVPGDLIITMMELAHENFVRQGNDLKINVDLTYPQLILGDKIDVPTIDGTKIRVTIPEYTKVGTNLKIPNKGLKQLHYTNRGDMVISINLSVPNQVSEEEKNLIVELKKLNEKVATS
jgi:molecular chaperone DnaJ